MSVITRTVPLSDAELWRSYTASGSLDQRNELVCRYESMARHEARSLARQIPVEGVDVDDFYAWGIEGLIKAIAAFEPDRGWKFETYALPRVRGEMIQGLRSLSWAPRSVRRNRRAVSDAVNELANRMRRTPTHAEVARHMGVSPDKIAEMIRLAWQAYPDSMDADVAIAGPDGDVHGVPRGESLASMLADPAAALEMDELRRLLAFSIGQLNDQHRVVLALVHVEGLQGKEAARLLGVRSTRFSQLHTAAILALRETLQQAAS